jgi:hypothetical protein
MEPAQPSSLPESGPTVSEVRTKSGRVSKPPVRYEPVEQVEDDYSAEDYDSDEDDDLDDDDDDDDEDDFDDDDEDADEDGNLDGFVVPDKSESDEEDNGRPIPPSVPVVKKRRT